MVAMIATSQKTAVLLVAGVMLVGACGSDGTTAGTSPSPSPNAITISGLAFKPDSLDVVAGTEVTWTNDESVRHTVTAGTPDMPSVAFDTGLDGAGAKFRSTFREAGTYPFFCRNHPNGMRGEIRVT
jgi:plastocyanin